MPLPAFNPAEQYRMQGLFRFVLALMVLWSHIGLMSFPEIAGWFPKLQLGNVAVSAFFVLSGFLMWEAVVIWYSKRLRNFIINRYLRIGPPLFLAAVFSVSVHFAFSAATLSQGGLEVIPATAVSAKNAILALLAPIFPLDIVFVKFFNIYPDLPYQFVRFSWAIFTELMFYWSLFLYFFFARFLGVRLADLAGILAILAMFLVGVVVYNGFFQDLPLIRVIEKIPLVFHLQWAPHFLLGVMIARCARDGWGSVTLIAVLVGSALAAAVQLGLYSRHGGYELLLVPGLYGATLFVGFRFILSDRRHFAVGSLRLERQADRRFGGLSYPVYINQYAIVLLALGALTAFGVKIEVLPLVARVVVFVILNLIVIGVAAFLIKLTDSLTDSLRDRLRGAVIWQKNRPNDA